MAFQFPDPNVTPEFTGDNGITYSWDATDGKWVTKSFGVEQPEDFDPQLKEHVCAEFFKVVADYGAVEASDGHSMASYDFADSGIKYWTKPPKVDFFVNGEEYYINDQGPYTVEQLQGGAKWVTFFIKGGPKPAVGGMCKFSKTRKLCTEINSLNQDIIELEEEIDAIIPSVERGTWQMTLSGVVGEAGKMSLYDDNYTNVGSPTGLFINVKSIWLNEIDNSGTPHGFANVEAGELIELFVQGQPEYGLYEVVAAHDETGGASQWWVIEVNFVRTLENTSTADNGDLIRVKIFQAPSSGGSAGGPIFNYTKYPIAQYNDYNPYDWRTYTVPPGKMMGAGSGSYGITSQKSVMFRDLYTLFPQEEWEFIPGWITFYQYQEHDNFPFWINWAFRVASMHRWDEYAQVFQLHWNNDSSPT